MSLKQFLIVALALAPIGACDKSNTVEQNQSKGIDDTPPSRVGSGLNPHMPNAVHAGSGEVMGSAAMQPGAANNEMGSAAGAGAGSAAGSAAAGATSGSAAGASADPAGGGGSGAGR